MRDSTGLSGLTIGVSFRPPPAKCQWIPEIFGLDAARPIPNFQNRKFIVCVNL